jgi:tetratricopeptide (TPR) repeat protein
MNKNNYRNKTAPVNDSPDTEFEDIKQKNKINFLNYLNRNLIIITAVIVSIFFIQKEIQYLGRDLDFGDEDLNMLTVKNIAATGLPVYGTFYDNVTSPLYNNDALTVIYWEYAAELYLRTPVFLLSKIIDFRWEYYSSLIYLYLIFILIIFYCLKNRNLDKASKLPFMFFGFFILIFSLSKLSVSQFHYVRYYPFTLIIIPLSHYFTNRAFINPKYSSFKKYLLIIILSFIPGLFHMVNLSYMFFWVSFLFLYYLISIFKNNLNLSFKSFFTKNLKFVISLIVLIIILCFLVNFVTEFLKNRLYFSYENLRFIPGFLSYYFNIKFIAYDFIFLMLLIFSIVKIKKFTKIELSMFLTSSAFLIFCFIGFSIMGGKELITNPGSYMLFLFPIIIMLLSLMLSLLFRTIQHLMPDFYFKDFIIFYVIALAFIIINSQKLNDHERRTRSKREFLNIFNETVEKFKNCVFVTSKNTHYFFNYFPHNKAYLYRPHDEIKAANIIKNDFYKSPSGWVRNIGGEIYVGNPESFCRMLRENENNVIYFYFVMPELRAKLKKIYTGNPMSAKYLLAMFCSNNESEITQNSLSAIRGSGLLEEEYISLGAYLFNRNLYSDCITSCQKALSVNPVNTRAIINSGLCYYKLGKPEKSILLFKKALALNPDDENAQRYLQMAEENNKRILKN